MTKRSPVLPLTLLVVGVVWGQYSGTYTIMPSGGDFASHAEAAESLMAYGVVGPCTLLMYTGVYPGQASFDHADWDSVEVVFRAADDEEPIVQYTGSPWNICFTDRVKVDGIRILSSLLYGAYVYRSNRFSLCNCCVTASGHGLYLCYSDSCRIVGNDIQAGSDGIHAEYSGNRLYIVGNDIEAPYHYGLYLYRAADSFYSYYDTVANNMVYARSNGVYSCNRRYPCLVYNTMWADWGPALRADRNYNCTWLSNLICNRPDLLDRALQGDGTIDRSDYNCWFTSDTYMAYWNGMRCTWPAWQAAGYDPHGMFREPGVGGPLNLHLAPGSPCIDSGLAIPEFPLDIDGDGRGSSPDIGADEYTGIGQPMAGTYLIHPDPDSGDYSTFNQAIGDMQLRGYAGDITFDVAGGTYRENVFLMAMANGSHSVTFRARDGAMDTVPAGLNAGGNYAVDMFSVSRFKFRGLHIAGAGYGVHTGGTREKGCDSIVIADCQIDAGGYGIYMYNGVDDCSIVGNVITAGGSYGICVRGWGSSPEGRCLRNVFANNIVQDWTTYGLDLHFHEGTRLIFNTLYGNGSYGMYDYYGYAETWHGTIFFGNTYAVYKEYGTVPLYSDYNCYWPDAYPFYHSAHGAMSPDQWRSCTRLDSHSIYRDPLCVSYRDGHLRSQSPCRDSAAGWPGFPLDVDGDIRTGPTDIGADDFQLTGFPLSGTYLIHQRPDSGDYRSFHEATCDLMTWGCSGPVVFDVAAGTYQEAVEVRQLHDGYPVTYQARGDERVTIDATRRTHGVELTGTDHARFRNFTVLARDCGIRFLHSGDDGCDGCLVEGCSLVGLNGVDMRHPTDHCSLVGNYITSDSGFGVFLSGLLDEPNVGNVFVNNMLTGADWGISCNHHDSTTLIYNSIWSRGLHAFYDHYGYNARMQDNILRAPSHAWHKLYGGVLPMVSDFNCFWTDDPDHRVIYHSSLGHVPLAEWQEFSNLDSNSIAADPMFVSAADLHLTVNSPCIDAGGPILGITVDIDGERRDSTPCIGADEVKEASIGQSGELLTVDLSRPAPNPAFGAVRIRWQMPGPGRVSLKVYSITGQCVTTLVDGMAEGGVHVTVWHGRDNRGRRLASGIYFCTLEAGDTRLTRKVVIQR